MRHSWHQRRKPGAYPKDDASTQAPRTRRAGSRYSKRRITWSRAARLAILDPRPEGNQPMWNADRTIGMVYNGEIFNYRELKEKEGLDCRTGTDTVVILKLYEKHGIECIEKLQGMFAFGLYDTQTHTWYLARDPGGIKPLYYTQEDGNLLFASEVRALLAGLKTKPALNYAALSQYMRLQYVPGPHTLCEGIKSLPPGHLLTWKDGKQSIQSFNTTVFAPTFRTAADLKEALPQLLDTTVKAHLVSDKPVGIFLSGGMDSSVLLHHMSNHAQKPIRTFTVRFDATREEGAKRFNTDADLAAKTAEHYGTEHTEVLLTAQTCRETYRATARALDLPNADAVAPAQLLLSQVAKNSVDVVLAGAGGDELFGGYPRYRIAHILQSLRFIPAALRGIAGKLLGYPSDVLQLSPSATLAERLLARPTTEIEAISNSHWFDASSTSTLFQKRFNALQALDSVRAFMECDRTLWLVDESLRLADAMTMASGLECRVPFVDHTLTHALKQTPGNWHLDLRRTKTLLKDTYRGTLPDHLYTLPKASFYPPLAKWLRRECAPLIEETLENQRIKELFNTDVLRKQFKAHTERKSYHLHSLSSVMVLGYWFEEVYGS